MKNALFALCFFLSCFMATFAKSQERHVVKQYPQNAELIKKIGKPADIEDNIWNMLTDRVVKYPMEFKLFDERVCLLRIAANPTTILLDDTWTIEEGQNFDKEQQGRKAESVNTVHKIVKRNDHNYFVYLVLNQQPSHGDALVNVGCNVLVNLLSCNRLNTIYGGEVIPVKDATFVANFNGEINQTLVWTVGNVAGTIRTRDEKENDFIGNAKLCDMASKISALFGPPPATTLPADTNGLVVTLNRNGEQCQIVVTTPASGLYKDWWLRLDATTGEWMVEVPGHAILKKIPAARVPTITVYIISPDGKQWYRLSKEVK